MGHSPWPTHQQPASARSHQEWIGQRMADGSIAVNSHDSQKQVAHIRKTVKKYNWARHLEKEIDPLLVHRGSSILGAMVVVEQRSTRKSWLRKKYMGVWRWRSALVASSSSAFPETQQVEGQEEPKEELWFVWVTGEPWEDKVRVLAAVHFRSWWATRKQSAWRGFTQLARTLDPFSWQWVLLIPPMWGMHKQLK